MRPPSVRTLFSRLVTRTSVRYLQIEFSPISDSQHCSPVDRDLSSPQAPFFLAHCPLTLTFRCIPVLRARGTILRIRSASSWGIRLLSAVRLSQLSNQWRKERCLLFIIAIYLRVVYYFVFSHQHTVLRARTRRYSSTRDTPVGRNSHDRLDDVSESPAEDPEATLTLLFSNLPNVPEFLRNRR
jgi:hypothetical protein